MIDLKLDKNGDLALSDSGDISVTDSIIQAVRIRLLWFFGEWRLSPTMGFPYFEHLFVKNPNETKLRHLIRETVLQVDGVADVSEIVFQIDRKMRQSTIFLTVKTDEDIFREEVKLKWNSMA